MTTGVWPQISADIIDSDDARPREAWTGGLTGWGKPPRDNTARLRRQILAIVVGYALVGAAIARVMYLLGALGGTG